LVDHFRLERPIVLGHSWGGEVAVVYASLFTDCGGVVGVDGWITDMNEAIPSETWQWVEDDYAAEPFMRFAGTGDQLEQALAFIRQMYGDAGADVTRRQLVEGDDGLFRWRRTVPELVTVQRLVAEQAGGVGSEVYGSIRCPVLLLGAERSEAERRAADPEGRLGTWGYNRVATEAVVGRFPHVQSRWFPCGHDVPSAMPEALAQTLHEFSRALR
jgi:pimeloyl-ACP methyl ester carboxylesterase